MAELENNLVRPIMWKKFVINRKEKLNSWMQSCGLIYKKSLIWMIDLKHNDKYYLKHQTKTGQLKCILLFKYNVSTLLSFLTRKISKKIFLGYVQKQKLDIKFRTYDLG